VPAGDLVQGRAGLQAAAGEQPGLGVPYPLIEFHFR
jgi:hypothetical protein